MKKIKKLTLEYLVESPENCKFGFAIYQDIFLGFLESKNDEEVKNRKAIIEAVKNDQVSCKAIENLLQDNQEFRIYFYTRVVELMPIKMCCTELEIFGYYVDEKNDQVFESEQEYLEYLRKNGTEEFIFVKKDKKTVQESRKVICRGNLSEISNLSLEGIFSFSNFSINTDYDTLINNIELVKFLIYFKKVDYINCFDYESAIYLENNIEGNFEISLIDDFKNVDRSYINPNKFQNHKLNVPLSYVMWAINIQEEILVKIFSSSTNYNMFSANGDESLEKSILDEVTKIVTSLNEEGLSDLDKVIIVSNYIQSKIQYVSDIISPADRNYSIEASPQEVSWNKTGLISTVINNNYGLCMAIANATTVLLNNPTMNVNIRSVFGSSHVWNIVNIDGNFYYIDNTWGITRNPNRVNEALKAQSFSDEYLLFGNKTAIDIGHHEPETVVEGTVEQQDFNKAVIRQRVKKLSSKVDFENYSSPLAFPSKVVD